MDSLVRLRQLNNPEVSGFIVAVLNQYLSGNAVTLGSTGALTGVFYPKHPNISGYLTGIPNIYVLQSDTGNFLAYTDSRYLNLVLAQTESLYSQVTITGSSGIRHANLTGIGGMSVFYASGNVYFSGSSSISGFLTTGQTGNFITTSQTGQFVTTGQTGRFVTTGQTGNFITTGQTGQFYPAVGNPSSFITSSQTGIFATTGSLTQYYLNSNPKHFISKDINGVSELSNTSLALFDTDANNYTFFFNSNNGGGGSFYLKATNNKSIIDLYGSQTSFGGSAITGYAYIDARNFSRSGETLSTIKITGSPALSGVNFSGTSGVKVFVSGNVVLVDGNFLQTYLNTFSGWTGSSTGLYYPRNGNPSGFITSLNLSDYYLANNPSGFIYGGVGASTQNNQALLLWNIDFVDNFFHYEGLFGGSWFLKGGDKGKCLIDLNGNDNALRLPLLSGFEGIFRNSGDSIDVLNTHQRKLSDGTNLSVDWSGRKLINANNGIATVDWENFILSGANSTASIPFAASTNTIDWNNGNIIGWWNIVDSNGQTALSSPFRTLTDSSGRTVLDWGSAFTDASGNPINPHLRDLTNNYAMFWTQRQCIDSVAYPNQKVSIDWGQRTLLDNSGLVSLNWGTRTLSGNWNVGGQTGFLRSGVSANFPPILISGSGIGQILLNISGNPNLSLLSAYYNNSGRVISWIDTAGGIGTEYGISFGPFSGGPVGGFIGLDGVGHMSFVDSFNNKTLSSLITTSQTGLFYPRNNPSGFIPADNGTAASLNIISTLHCEATCDVVLDSGVMVAFDVNAWIEDSNEAERWNFKAGDPFDSVSKDTNTVSKWGDFDPNYFSFNYNTGSSGISFIVNSLTGSFYPRNNISGFITNSQTGNFLTLASNYGVKTVAVTGGNISGNINVTGIGGLVVLLSGNNVLISGGGAITGYVTSGQTGSFITTGQTGQFRSPWVTSGNYLYYSGRNVSIGPSPTGFNAKGNNERLFTLEDNSGVAIELVRRATSGPVGMGEISWINSNNSGSHQNIAYIQALRTTSIGSGAGAILQFATKQDNITGAIERMRIDASGNVGISTTTQNLALSVGDDYSLNPPSNLTGTFNYSAGSEYFNVGYTHTLRVYSYKSSPLGRVFSPFYTSVSITDDGSATANYTISWSWDAVPNADGYLLLKDDNANNWAFAFGYDNGSSNSLSEIDSSFWSAGGDNTVVPKAYSRALNADAVNSILYTNELNVYNDCTVSGTSRVTGMCGIGADPLFRLHVVEDFSSDPSNEHANTNAFYAFKHTNGRGNNHQIFAVDCTLGDNPGLTVGQAIQVGGKWQGGYMFFDRINESLFMGVHGYVNHVSFLAGGGLVIGGSIATSETKNFLYLPSVAGVPNGTVPTQNGPQAITFDTTNEDFYVYNVSKGGWRRFGANRFYPSGSNPSGYITASQTGQFYPRSGNISGFLTSGINSLIVTGSATTGQVTLSGIGGTSITSSGQVIFISGGSSINTGSFVTTGQTGSFYSTSNPSGFITGFTGITIQATNVAAPSGNFSLDWRLSSSFLYTLSGNTTFSFTGCSNGQTIVLGVSNTGTYTATFPSGATGVPSGITGVIWPNSTAPTQSTGTFLNPRLDIYTFIDMNNKIYGNVVKNFY